VVAAAREIAALAGAGHAAPGDSPGPPCPPPPA
jgi:hypothetical protein